MIYSDDEGEHWTEAAERPGCSPPTLGDWPKIFAGPHRGEAPAGYPNAVYLCNFIPNILVAASIGCWRSDDGGDHFEFASFLPTVNGACRPARSRAAPARRSSTAAAASSPTASSSSR